MVSNIGNRLRAVENIKKITTSMEMVSSARLRKAQIKARQGQFYIAKIEEILERLERASTEYKHPFFEQREPKKALLVLVSSDKGLCGSYNTRVFSQADRFIKSNAFESVELMLLGRKAQQYYQRKKYQIAEGSREISTIDVKELSDRLIKSFLENEADVIWLIYTKFYNLMQREVVTEKFLPIGKPKSEKATSLNYILEPNLEEIYSHLLERFCMTKIRSMLSQSYASELAARIFAMKTASTNAEEMLQDLTLEHNKMRQAGITREILETTGSAG